MLQLVISTFDHKNSFIEKPWIEAKGPHGDAQSWTLVPSLAERTCNELVAAFIVLTSETRSK